MNTTPAAQQPPTIPLAGAWQPLPNAGATPHTPDAPESSTNRWIARAFLAIIMIACVSVGTWSIYTLITQNFHAPQGVGYLGAGVFDIAALYFAYLGQQYATTTDSGLAPRLAMLATISLSVYVNWTHAQLEGWGSIGGIVLAAPSVVAEVAFEMWHKFEHRETLRRLGRVAQTLPVIGKWAWLRHPVRSQKAIDAHIKAALTEHEAVATRREEIAGVRARFLVQVPIAPAVELQRIEVPAPPVVPELAVQEVREPIAEPPVREPAPAPEPKAQVREPAPKNQPNPEPANLTDRAANKQNQIDEVLNLMTELGYDAVKLGLVIERTGMSKTTAYHRLNDARSEWAKRNAA